MVIDLDNCISNIFVTLSTCCQTKKWKEKNLTEEKEVEEEVVMWVCTACSSLVSYDKVSANTASSVPKCYKKSDGSQDARRGSPDMPNQPPEDDLVSTVWHPSSSKVR